MVHVSVPLLTTESRHFHLFVSVGLSIKPLWLQTHGAIVCSVDIFANARDHRESHHPHYLLGKEVQTVWIALCLFCMSLNEWPNVIVIDGIVYLYLPLFNHWILNFILFGEFLTCVKNVLLVFQNVHTNSNDDNISVFHYLNKNFVSVSVKANSVCWVSGI